MWHFVLALLNFTPKDSAHCIHWAYEAPPSLIPTEAPGGLAASDDDRNNGPLMCRRRVDMADANADTCSASAVRIGEASTHLDVGVIASGGICVPLSEPMPNESQDSDRVLHTVQINGPLEYMIVDPTCDVWWREVSEDVIPPIPELVRTLGTAPSGAKLALCRTFGDGAFGDGGVTRPGTLVVEGPDFGKCFFTRADGSTGVIDGGRFHVLQACHPCASARRVI